MQIFLYTLLYFLFFRLRIEYSIYKNKKQRKEN